MRCDEAIWRARISASFLKKWLNLEYFPFVRCEIVWPLNSRKQCSATSRTRRKGNYDNRNRICGHYKITKYIECFTFFAIWTLNTYMWHSIFPNARLMRYQRPYTQSFSDLIVLSIGSIFVLAARYLTWIFHSGWIEQQLLFNFSFAAKCDWGSLRLIFID